MFTVYCPADIFQEYGSYRPNGCVPDSPLGPWQVDTMKLQSKKYFLFLNLKTLLTVLVRPSHNAPFFDFQNTFTKILDRYAIPPGAQAEERRRTCVLDVKQATTDLSAFKPAIDKNVRDQAKLTGSGYAPDGIEEQQYFWENPILSPHDIPPITAAVDLWVGEKLMERPKRFPLQYRDKNMTKVPVVDIEVRSATGELLRTAKGEILLPSRCKAARQP